MFEIKGARNTAICYADIVEGEAISQIMRMWRIWIRMKEEF